jgi:hypothetical protein
VVYTHRGSTSGSASRNLSRNEIGMQPTMHNLQRAPQSASQHKYVDQMADVFQREDFSEEIEEREKSKTDVHAEALI